MSGLSPRGDVCSPRALSNAMRALVPPPAVVIAAARDEAAHTRQSCLLAAAGLFVAACVTAALVLLSWSAARQAGAHAYLSPYERACTLFCSGPLLRAVQLSHLFGDGKTFVDMPARRDPAAILAAYDRRFGLLSERDGPPPRDELAQFIDAHFDAAGSDQRPWTPTDWTPMPAALASLRSEELRLFGLGLHDLWLELGRVQDVSVMEHPERHSLLYLPFPVIVPGGRFREVYAWDTYWISRGLLRSGMTATARGLLGNLLHLVQMVHFVPNGGRAYYAIPGRSQPPLLSRMVADTFEASLAAGDGGPSARVAALAGLAEAFPALVLDYSWWTQTEGTHPHSVHVLAEGASGGGGGEGSGNETAPTSPRSFVLTRYISDQTTPRPESYAEDIATAAAAGFADPTSSAAQGLFEDIAAAAESGWDFSSRFLKDGVSLSLTDTSLVIPADLQAFLLVVEHDLATFAGILADEQAASCEALSPSAFVAERGNGSFPSSTSTASVASTESPRVSAGAGRAAAASSSPLTVPSRQRRRGGGRGSSGGGGGASSVYCRRHPRKALCRLPPSGERLSPIAQMALEGAEAARARVRDWHAEALAPRRTVRAATPVPACALRDAFRADAARFELAASERLAAMEALMWDEGAAQWRDLRIIGTAPPPAPVPQPLQPNEAAASAAAAELPPVFVTVRSNSSFASNFVPLWALGILSANADPQDAPLLPPARADAIAAALAASGLVGAGGIISSAASTSSQQWDWPNAWAPLQGLLVDGLRASRSLTAAALADKIAKRFLRTAMASFLHEGYLHEKYDGRVDTGMSGRGGEYAPQLGFGWSIGVALDLITSSDFANLVEE